LNYAYSGNRLYGALLGLFLRGDNNLLLFSSSLLQLYAKWKSRDLGISFMRDFALQPFMF